MQLTHRNLASNDKVVVGLIPGGIRKDDKQPGVLPLFHIYWMTVTMNATLFDERRFYPLPSWDAQQSAFAHLT